MSHARSGWTTYAGMACLLIALASSACGGKGPAQETPPPVPHDTPAQVLSAFVAGWCAESAESAPQALLFHAATSAPKQAPAEWVVESAWLRKKLEGLRADTLADFARANATPLDLRGILTSPLPLHFVTAEEYEGELEETGNALRASDDRLRRLMGRHPGVRWIRALSAPGVSAAGRQALVYATEVMGARVASGYYFLLAWDEEAWRITGKVMAWVS